MFRKVYHVWCIRVALEVLGFGRFLCSERSKVALRVSMVVRSVVFDPILYPLGSLASMTLVGEMWYEASGEAVWCEVISLCHVNVFVLHRWGQVFEEGVGV